MGELSRRSVCARCYEYTCCTCFMLRAGQESSGRLVETRACTSAVHVSFQFQRQRRPESEQCVSSESTVGLCLTLKDVDVWLDTVRYVLNGCIARYARWDRQSRPGGSRWVQAVSNVALVTRALTKRIRIRNTSVYMASEPFTTSTLTVAREMIARVS